MLISRNCQLGRYISVAQVVRRCCRASQLRRKPAQPAAMVVGLRDGKVAFRVVRAEQVVVEHDRVHRAGVLEQHRHGPGVDHCVPDEAVHPGMDPGVLLDVQPIAEQPALRQQVIDNIPGPIHEIVDRRFHRWSRHRVMIPPAADRVAELFPRVPKMRNVARPTAAASAVGYYCPRNCFGRGGRVCTGFSQHPGRRIFQTGRQDCSRNSDNGAGIGVQ
jgi:hypothetical protein